MLCGCRLWPCRCDRLAPALWAVLVPAVCWPAPVALWLCPCLEAVPLPCGLCWWRLSARALPGAMWGVYIQLSGDYTGRVKPLPARLAVSLAACFRPLPGAVPEAAAGPVMGRRSCRLPVHLWAAPPGAFVGSCLLSAGVLEPPAATDRPTENAGENAPDFPGLFAGPLPPPVQVQDAPRLHVSRRAAPGRPPNWKKSRRKIPAGYFTRPV